MLSVPSFFDDSDAVVLNQAWFVKRTKEHGIVLVLPDDPNNTLWKINKRLAERTLECTELGQKAHNCCAKVVLLQGPLDAAEMSLAGLDYNTISLFQRGIPENWESIFKPTEPVVEVEKENVRRRSIRVASKPVQISLDEDALLLQALRKSEADATKSMLLQTPLAAELNKLKPPPVTQAWNKVEKLALHQALLCVPSNAQEFWQACAHIVTTKSAKECEARWLEETAAAATQSKATTTTAQPGNECEAMKRHEKIAKLGTAKFRQQVRKDWEASNLRKPQATCTKLTTPFRNRTLRSSDADLNAICTPINTFVFGDGQDNDVVQITPLLARLVKEEQQNDEPVDSPEVLQRVNRDHLDDYVVSLLKQSAANATGNGKKKTKRTKSVKRTKIDVTPVQPRRFKDCTTTTTIEEGDVAASLTPGGSVHLIVKNSAVAAHMCNDAEDVVGSSDEEEEWGK